MSELPRNIYAKELHEKNNFLVLLHPGTFVIVLFSPAVHLVFDLIFSDLVRWQLYGYLDVQKLIRTKYGNGVCISFAIIALQKIYKMSYTFYINIAIYFFETLFTEDKSAFVISSASTPWGSYWHPYSYSKKESPSPGITYYWKQGPT